MIGTLLPAPVSAAEAFEDPPGLTLLGLEREAVRTAAPKRLAEFTTARWCARRALAGLGMPPVPIPRGRRGAPVWPPGIVGSMTHHDGYRAAAVARQADARSLGIDAEPHLPLPDGVLELIALPTELRRIAELSGRHPLVHWDRLLFSMKESVYKAWFPPRVPVAGARGGRHRHGPGRQLHGAPVRLPSPGPSRGVHGTLDGGQRARRHVDPGAAVPDAVGRRAEVRGPRKWGNPYEIFMCAVCSLTCPGAGSLPILSGDIRLDREGPIERHG